MKKISYLLMLFCLSSMLFGCMESTAAKSVMAQIDQLGETIESEDAVHQVRDAYDALSDKEKETVKNFSQLQTAEDMLPAAQVDMLIEAIGEINEDSLVAINKAKAAYQDLTKSQKDKVKNKDLLRSKEEEFSQFQVSKVISLFQSFNYGSFTQTDIQQAETLYHDLDERQRIELKKQITSPEQALQTAKIKLAQRTIETISYKNGKPDIAEISSLLAAQKACEGLSADDISNYKTLSKAIGNYKKYQEKNPRMIRQNYLAACRDIPYSSLVDYPSQYKGEKIRMNVTLESISAGNFISPDSITAVLADGNSQVIFTDNRSVKEPKLKEGITLTLYGTVEGTKTISVKEKNSEAKGPFLFPKNTESYDVPFLKMVYCSLDYDQEDSEYIALESELNELLNIK